MINKDLFLPVKECQELQNLGLDMSDATFCWYNTHNQEYDIYFKDKLPKELGISTYTLQEILDKLPYGNTWDTHYWELTNGHSMEYNDGDGYSPYNVDGWGESNPIMYCAFKMLEWTLTRNYVQS